MCRLTALNMHKRPYDYLCGNIVLGFLLPVGARFFVSQHKHMYREQHLYTAQRND